MTFIAICILVFLLIAAPETFFSLAAMAAIVWAFATVFGVI